MFFMKNKFEAIIILSIDINDIFTDYILIYSCVSILLRLSFFSFFYKNTVIQRPYGKSRVYNRSQIFYKVSIYLIKTNARVGCGKMGRMFFVAVLILLFFCV